MKQDQSSAKRAPTRGVSLPEGHTGSSFFHSILAEAVAQHPELKDAGLSPRPERFRQNFGTDVVRFEAARLASEARSEIAETVVRRTQAGLVYRAPGASAAESFGGYLAQAAPAFPVEQRAGSGAGGLAPSVSFRGREYGAAKLGALAGLLLEHGFITQAGGDALSWIGDYALKSGGKIDLRGKRFALLGAAAELAPTHFLLEAGASVLWLDLTPPKLSELPLTGELTYVPGGSDLLLEPLRCKQTLIEFAGDQPLHLGLYAYAGGESQEWRLASTMNGIARSLPERMLESIAMWISPTSPGSVQPGCASVVARRREKLPLWQAALRQSGVLRRGHEGPAGAQVSRAIVPVQGVSYQAAQYIAKVLAAEVYAIKGSKFGGAPRPITVSANVAGITRTRSLAHPVFEAAFLGAPAFNIEIFQPETTRSLATLLMLHDLLNPSCPANASTELSPSERATRLSEVQVHGGVYTNPHALDGAIKVAAVMGMGRRPSLARRLLTRSA